MGAGPYKTGPYVIGSRPYIRTEDPITSFTRLAPLVLEDGAYD